ncbi:hypothetical protein [Mycolicibacterium sp.]|uniref:hypothetical protein n=1 Tax=Mycolicibacterium sp. TaxID=2320850 RepID=UPI001A2CE2BA|nr:hypothetical protein [Mycolicibacterium sp.]MBJ7336956.1 hypothetical protein [Mycolicibacterium sp.]
MKRFAIMTFASVALSGAALAFAGSASAAGADVTVNDLHSQGYIVQLNGAQSAPLTACTVTNVSGPSDVGSGGHTAVAVVDIACPQGC